MAAQMQRTQATPQATPVLPIDEGAVAEFLLRKKYFLAALELHQELQEGNNGMHSVSPLNKFFNDANVYQNLAKKVADEEAKNKAQSHGGKTASVQSPFISDGLQAALASRDQKIALLEYRLRCTEVDATAAKQQLQGALAALQTGGAGPTSGKDASSSSSSSSSGPDEDLEGGRIAPHEQRVLNALVRRYLLARGYKATAVALAEDVTDQDLTGDTDDSNLLGLPGSRSGGGRPVLTLLGLHRVRIAPIQAVLAESEKRADSELAGVRAELRAVHEQCEAASAEAAARASRVAELEAELMHARMVRGGGGQVGVGQQVAQPAPPPAASTAIPVSAAPAGLSLGGKITLSHAPALLRAVTAALPALHKITVSTVRAALAPLLAHAVAAEPGLEARRSLLLSFLHMLRRPTYAERQLLKAQFGAMAGRLGSGAAEQELLPEIALLAKTGKGKEKRALAACLAGALAVHVSDRRVDALLATLGDLADSRHAVVRVAVIDGLASVTATLAERWGKSLAGGVVPGQGSGVESFALRQYSALEEVMWRAVIGPGGEGGGGVGAAEAEELDAAADREHLTPLAIPHALALAGTPSADKEDGAGKLAPSGLPGKSGIAPMPLPAAWFSPPPSVLQAACTLLIPSLVPWAYRLGGLWTRTLPGWVAQLQDTLSTPVPGSAATVQPPGTPCTPLRATEWHARHALATLHILAASAVRVRQAVLDSGPTITYTGPADVGGEEGAGVPTSSDYIYELFDNCSGAAVTSFPPELPLSASLRAGAVVLSPGVGAGGVSLPQPQRQALVMAALLRGTASVRRRRNGPVNIATLPPGTAVWQILPDAQAAVSWPSLAYTLRALLPTLLHQASRLSRSSQAGRDIGDGYAEAIASLGAAMGSAFTSHAIRPAFLRAMGIPVECPPPLPLPGAAPTPPAVPGLPQPLALALQPGQGGRSPSLLPLAQCLLGVPAAAADARKAAMAAAVGNFAPPLNYASAGPRGGDWVYVLPELGWMGKDSPENTCHAGKSASALSALVETRKAEIAACPPPTAPGVPAALIRDMLGGAWNGEWVLPLFGSGVLACPALSSREHLDHAVQGMVGRVAAGQGGWGSLQSLLEECVLRAGGGAGGAAAGGLSTTIKHGGGGGGGDPAAAIAERAAFAASNLKHILHDILPRMAGGSDVGVRTCAAGLLRSLIPLLAPDQIADPWLPTVKRLAGPGEPPAVVRAAVRALATIYSTPAANDAEVRGLVNGEVTSLLASGPKDVILEVLRSLMRSVPVAPPATRDGFILDRLLEMAERVVSSAEAGAVAMKELVAQIGDVDPGDVHNAAAAALRSTRAAAIQAAAPWPGALPDDLEETAMALCECFRAYGSVIVSGDVKGMLREAGGRLLRADVLEPSYRDMMRVTLASLFPLDVVLPSPRPVREKDGGGYGYSVEAHGAAEVGQVHAHADILSAFEAERQGGLLPPTAFDFEARKQEGGGAPGGGLDDSMEMAAKDFAALGSSLSHAMKGISLKGVAMPLGGMSMSMGGMSFGRFGLGGGTGAAAGSSSASGAAGGKGTPQRAEGGGMERAAEAPTLSLSAFAAPAGGGESRRASGTAQAEQPAFTMSSFMANPAPAPAQPAPSVSVPAAVGGAGAGDKAGGGLLKGKAVGGTTKGMGFGDRMKKLGNAMDKMMEQ